METGTKILVTGATGFIGSHLVEHLIKEGNEVFCLVRSKNNLEFLDKEKINLIYGDLSNLEDEEIRKAVAGADVIYHLAARTVRGDLGSLIAEDFYDFNIQTTNKLAELALANKNLKRFIFFSSIAAVGLGSAKTPINENHPCRPEDDYGRSKLASENFLKNLYWEKGLPLVIIRPTSVYGPRETGLQLKLFKAIWDKRFMLIGGGRNLASFVYVKNVVAAAILAKDNDRAVGQTYFVNDDQPYTLAEIARAIARAEGRKIPKFSLPKLLAYLIAYPLAAFGAIFKFSPPLFPGRVKTMTSSYVYNIDKIKNELGYSQKYDLETGTRETVAWYRNNNYLNQNNPMDKKNLTELYNQFDDGLGGSYERIVLFYMLDKLAKKYQVKKILELNATYICGVPAFSSALLAMAGYEVTIMVHSRDYQRAINAWTRAGLLGRVKIIEGNNDYHTPFSDNEFDLVWNHIVIGQYVKPNPQKLIAEMKRVSNNLVLTSSLAPNSIGYWSHYFSHYLKKNPWNHGCFRFQTVSGMKKQHCLGGLKILDADAVDTPPWFDTVDAGVGGDMTYIKSSVNKKWIWSILDPEIKNRFWIKFFWEFEKTLPFWLKNLFTHHLYVLSSKKEEPKPIAKKFSLIRFLKDLVYIPIWLLMVVGTTMLLVAIFTAGAFKNRGKEQSNVDPEPIFDPGDLKDEIEY